MDLQFGRTRTFLVVCGRTGKTLETIDNPSADLSYGAGIAAADLLSSAGVQAVLSGRFGAKALEALRTHEIEAWVAPPGVNAGRALLMFEGERQERRKHERAETHRHRGRG
jgi:predicted Fe-Mo cluster-binding NifX family protein